MLFPLRGRFGIHLAFGKIIFKVQLEPPPNVWPVRVALSFTCGLITSSSATFSTKTNLKASDSLGEVEQSAFRTSDETLADESALRRRDVQFHIFVNMLAVNVKKNRPKPALIGCISAHFPSHFDWSFSRIEWTIHRMFMVDRETISFQLQFQPNWMGHSSNYCGERSNQILEYRYDF